MKHIKHIDYTYEIPGILKFQIDNRLYRNYIETPETFPEPHSWFMKRFSLMATTEIELYFSEMLGLEPRRNDVINDLTVRMGDYLLTASVISTNITHWFK
jgi:hypothetical protein